MGGVIYLGGVRVIDDLESVVGIADDTARGRVGDRARIGNGGYGWCVNLGGECSDGGRRQKHKKQKGEGQV